MATLKTKEDELIKNVNNLLNELGLLKNRIGSDLDKKDGILNITTSIYKSLIEIDGQAEEIKTITYRFADLKTEMLNGEGKSTFRDKNHKFENKIKAALYGTEFLKEQINSDSKDLSSLLKSIDYLENCLNEISKRFQEIRVFADRFVDSNKEIYLIESTLKEENKQFKILIADDDPEVLHFSRQRVEKQGFTVFTAANVAVALKILKENKPDIVVLDLAMPEHMEGLEVLKFIRNNQLPTKCIIATVTDTDEELAIVNALKPENTLTKPFSLEKLTAQINALTTALRG